MGRMLSAMTHRRKDRESNAARAIVRTRRRDCGPTGAGHVNPVFDFSQMEFACAESSKFGGEVGCPRSQLGGRRGVQGLP